MTPVSYRVLERTTVPLAAIVQPASYATALAQNLDVVGWGSGVLNVRVFDQNIAGGADASVRIAVYNVFVDRDDPAVTFEGAAPIAYVDIPVGVSSSPQLLTVRLPTVADDSLALGRQVTVKMVVKAGQNSISGSLTLAVDLVGYRGMVGPRGSAGANAYATSTASFTAPAVNTSATLSTSNSSWAFQGQRVFLSDANNGVHAYFRVATNGMASSVSLLNEDGSAGGLVFAAGSNLSPAGEDGFPVETVADACLYRQSNLTTYTGSPLTLDSYTGVHVANHATASASAGTITANEEGDYEIDAHLRSYVIPTGGQVPGSVILYV